MQSGGLCAHVLLLQHSEGRVDIVAALRQINRRRGAGRPANAVRALTMQPDDAHDGNPAEDWIGVRVAVVDVEYHATAPFIGEVVRARGVYHAETRENLGILYRVRYRAQHGFLASEDEMMLEALRMAAQTYEDNAAEV